LPFAGIAFLWFIGVLRDRTLAEESVLIPPLLLLNLFVVVVMFSIGLRVSGGELLDILRNRALFVRTLLANCVLIPAIGFLLVRIFPLTPGSLAKEKGIIYLAETKLEW
jgi:predicted Na+-dependent transporter